MSKTYIADKDTLDAVNGKIGETTDTGADETKGSLFGKVNNIIAKLYNKDHGLLALKQEMGNIPSAVIDAMSGLSGTVAFTSDGTFTVPDGVNAVRLYGCGSGGIVFAGEYTLGRPIDVTPGEKIPIECGYGKPTKFGSYVTLLNAACQESLNSDPCGLGVVLGISGGNGVAGSKGSGSPSGIHKDWDSSTPTGSGAGGAGGQGGYGGAFGFGGAGGGGGGGAGLPTAKFIPDDNAGGKGGTKGTGGVGVGTSTEITLNGVVLTFSVSCSAGDGGNGGGINATGESGKSGYKGNNSPCGGTGGDFGVGGSVINKNVCSGGSGAGGGGGGGNASGYGAGGGQGGKGGASASRASVYPEGDSANKGAYGGNGGTDGGDGMGTGGLLIIKWGDA